MFPLSRMILLVCMVSLLAACGGGDSGSSSTPAPAPTYGAIYVNSLLAGGISGNYSSPTLAAETAKAYCVKSSSTTAVASTCMLVLEFGQNTCGAIYRGLLTATTGTYGVASAGTAAVAESNALAACKSKGVINCSFGLSACNGSGTPSSNSTTTLLHSLPAGSRSSGLPYEEGLSEILQSN